MNRRQSLRSLLVLLGGAQAPALISGLTAPKPPTPRLHIGAQTNIWGVPIHDYNELLRILGVLSRLGYEGFETNFKSLESRFGQAAQSRRDFEAHHVGSDSV